MYFIKVAARRSALSQAQIQEVLSELRDVYKAVDFEITLVDTTGDIDQKTSLVNLDKTNFFTKEVDDLVLQGVCDVGIHSAKDLPDPLPEGLDVYAITKGVDPSDALVLRKGDTFHSLKIGAKVGTSSLRRMEMLKKCREDLIAVDIRGDIYKRLKLLEDQKVDALIMAEAALIRLDLVHLNRVFLEGEVAPLQGRLAIVGRSDRCFIRDFFKKIHKE